MEKTCNILFWILFSSFAWTICNSQEVKFSRDEMEKVFEAKFPGQLKFLTHVLDTLFGVRQPEKFCDCGIKNDGNRIVGGQTAKSNEFPWQAAIKDRGFVFCGGSLISDTWILTAAHCLKGKKASEISVVLGEHDLRDDDPISVEYRAKKLVIHPTFDDTTIDGDVALIELDTSVTFTGEIRPVCLPFNKKNLVQSGNPVIISGWGTLSTNGPTSPILQKAKVRYISTAACRRSPYKYTSIGVTITNNMFCAGKKGVDSCQGDSGGPLTWFDLSGRAYQKGVVSFGLGCAEQDFPGVYTKVQNYLSWIEGTTKTKYCRHYIK